jgi:hypothetical protein
MSGGVEGNSLGRFLLGVVLIWLSPIRPEWLFPLVTT